VSPIHILLERAAPSTGRFFGLLLQTARDGETKLLGCRLAGTARSGWADGKWIPSGPRKDGCQLGSFSRSGSALAKHSSEVRGANRNSGSKVNNQVVRRTVGANTHLRSDITEFSHERDAVTCIEVRRERLPVVPGPGPAPSQLRCGPLRHLWVPSSPRMKYLALRPAPNASVLSFPPANSWPRLPRERKQASTLVPIRVRSGADSLYPPL